MTLVGASVAARGGRGVWDSTWRLLRLRLRIWFNGFRRARRGSQIGQIVLLLLLIGVMAFVFTVTRLILDFLQSPTFLGVIPDLPDLTASLPVMVMGAAFVGTLFTSFGVLLQALYLAGDMDFLLSAPIPIRAVFLSKLLQAVLPNFGVICLLTLPMLFGLGSVEGYGPAYYPLVVVTIAALSLAAAALAAMLVMSVVHFFPARRAAEILGFLGAVLAIVCSQSGQFFNNTDLTDVQIRQAAILVSRFDVSWSPIAWAGRGVIEVGRGEAWPGLAMTLGAITLAVGVFVVSLIAAERLYYSGWAGMAVVAGRRRRPRTSIQPVARRTRPASAWRAIIVKDFAVLRRDLRNLSQMVTPIVMGVIYAILIVRGQGEPPPGRGEAPEWFMEGFRGLLVFANVGISLFVGWMLSTRLGTTAFSQEGRSYWILKTAPVSTGRLLLAKYTVAYLPVAVLGCSFLFALSVLRAVPAGDVIFGLLIVALCYAALTGVNLALGVTAAVFDWEDPRRMMRGSVGCVSPILGLVALGVALALFAGPVVVGGAIGLPAAAGKILGVIIGGAACVATAVIPLYLVRNRVPRLADQ